MGGDEAVAQTTSTQVEVKAVASSTQDPDSLPALQDASDSEGDDSDNDQALADAMGGVHMHGSHRDPDLSLRSLESAGFAPKDEEVHMQAARNNDAARAKAFATLSQAEFQFALIGPALRKACRATKPAVMGDFQSVALGEAATAFAHQMSGLKILHAPAKVHTGVGDILPGGTFRRAGGGPYQ